MDVLLANGRENMRAVRQQDWRQGWEIPGKLANAITL
jgi:hypothetical protein